MIGTAEALSVAEAHTRSAVAALGLRARNPSLQPRTEEQAADDGALHCYPHHSPLYQIIRKYNNSLADHDYTAEVHSLFASIGKKALTPSLGSIII